MAEFAPGDQVYVNGSQPATIQHYDEPGNLVVFVITDESGGRNEVYAPISHTRLSHSVDDTGTAQDESVVLPAELVSDEFISGDWLEQDEAAAAVADAESEGLPAVAKSK